MTSKTIFAIILTLCFAISGAGVLRAQDSSALTRESQDQLASDGVPSAFRSTQLPLPRFVSLGSQKIFVRAGPGVRYPIKWVYERESFPVEIVLEYEVWRKIRDIDGEEGWVHQSLVSGKRFGLMKAAEPALIRSRPDEGGRPMARLEPMAQFAINECQPGWCKVSAQGYSGWLTRKDIWGIYENENFD